MQTGQKAIVEICVGLSRKINSTYKNCSLKKYARSLGMQYIGYLYAIGTCE